MSIIDIKDMVDKKDEKENETDNNISNDNSNSATNNGGSVNVPIGNNNNNTGGGYGTTEKCENVKRVLTNEEAGKKVASLMGASVGTGNYCDKLPPESVISLTSDGTCSYKVAFAYRTKSCVYYVGIETGNVLGNPSCTSKLVNDGEAQCIIMESMGITAREQFYVRNPRNNDSEWIYDIEDVYGVPDENGKKYVYEYHVSKSTGLITCKTVIRELQ